MPTPRSSGFDGSSPELSRGESHRCQVLPKFRGLPCAGIAPAASKYRPTDRASRVHAISTRTGKGIFAARQPRGNSAFGHECRRDVALCDVMDAACDSSGARAAARDLGRVPVIEPNARWDGKLKERLLEERRARKAAGAHCALANQGNARGVSRGRRTAEGLARLAPCTGKSGVNTASAIETRHEGAVRLESPPEQIRRSPLRDRTFAKAQY